MALKRDRSRVTSALAPHKNVMGTNLMDSTCKSGTWGLMMVDDDFVS